MVETMKVVAVVEVGDGKRVWHEVKIFEKTTPVENIISWAQTTQYGLPPSIVGEDMSVGKLEITIAR